ncbi:MAG: uridine kinase [Patescibacteria group bacterium]|nr:uridine kinase [Patescibacteria group bacterium]
MNPYVIAIAGGTGSGKSMFANLLEERFEKEVLVLPMDMYYKDQSHLPLVERLVSNMDNPHALDVTLFIEHLRRLSRGMDIEQPIYNFPTHTRNKKTVTLSSRPVIIAEGLLSFATNELREMCDLKIYIEVDDDIRLARRILRDVAEKRSETIEASLAQYLSSARPMHKIYVQPQKEFADLIIPWENEDKAAVDVVAARIFNSLHHS